MNPITAFLVFACLAGSAAGFFWGHLYITYIGVAAAVLIGLSLKMANVWQKFVILRMGKLQSVRGAGLFAIVPLLDHVVAVIDSRIQTTAFNAEQALTKDTVPVNVDAIIFWHVHDAEKGSLGHHQLPRSHRSGCADVAARNDRLFHVGRALIGPQRGG
jgi:regulator of protease activity HflC (stomatin/prohibitin superfamily)